MVLGKKKNESSRENPGRKRARVFFRRTRCTPPFNRARACSARGALARSCPPGLTGIDGSPPRPGRPPRLGLLRRFAPPRCVFRRPRVAVSGPPRPPVAGRLLPVPVPVGLRVTQIQGRPQVGYEFRPPSRRTSAASRREANLSCRVCERGKSAALNGRKDRYPSSGQSTTWTFPGRRFFHAALGRAIRLGKEPTRLARCIVRHCTGPTLHRRHHVRGRTTWPACRP